MQLILVIVVTLVTPHLVVGLGSPCATILSMRPDDVYDVKPHDMVDDPIPYKMLILNEAGFVTNTYIPGKKYTVKLTGPSYFRGFIVQPRLAVGPGQTVGHFRIGEFIEDPSTWTRAGVMYQRCNNLPVRNSITQINERKKFFFEVEWTVPRIEGPVQFSATILQNATSFWYFWRPESGFLRPARPGSVELTPLKNADGMLVEGSGQVATVTEQATTVLPSTKKPIVHVQVKQEKTAAPVTTVHMEPKTYPATQPPRPKPIATNPPTKRPAKIEPAKPVEHFDLPSDLIGTGRLIAAADPTLTRVFVPKPVAKEEMSDVDYCESFPCFNGATCENTVEGFHCICTNNWVGKQCLQANYCASEPCQNDGICTNSEFGVSCKCKAGWSGDSCSLECPEYLCKNDGVCVASVKGEYWCQCAPGWTGKKCDSEIDECAAEPCLNDPINCIDRFNDYQCGCSDGWVGKNCQQPCLDVYRSCPQWEGENKCEFMRPLTDFFDVNCPEACGQCNYLNTTVGEWPPLPPALRPFSFLIGNWVVNSSSNQHFPVAFRKEETFFESMNIKVAPVPMFGVPSLNVSTRAQSNKYMGNVQLSHGFLTLQPKGHPKKVSLSTTSNNGIVMIEEGELFPEEKEMVIRTVFHAAIPSMKNKVPKSMKRTFSLWGAYLRMTVEEELAEKRRNYYTLYYWDKNYYAVKN